jgi:hypothetical protein
VKGEHATVPDFFSRSSVLHALSRAGTVRAGKSEHRVRVLPVCDGHVGLVQRVGHDGFLQTFLLSKVVPTHSSEESVVQNLLLGLEGTGARPPRVICVSQVTRHGESITTIRWSWVSSRLDRRVTAFRGYICRGSVTRSLSGAGPQ